MAISRPERGVLPPGTLFGQRYEIVRCVKVGGMGVLYEVKHLETRRRRALKVMFQSSVSDPELRTRFKLEATVAAEVDSEHIVETLDAGIDADTGAPFIVMELLKGEDLAEMLARRGRLPAPEVLTLLHQAALALDKTHAAGIVHRDLKPENLFVARSDDGSPRLKILDFGIAKVLSQNLRITKDPRSIGTPLYMSPEQIQGSADIGPAADVYALAHIAFALLVGQAYFSDEAESLALYPFLQRVTSGAVEPARTRASRFGGLLSADFDVWFAKAVAVDPNQRFPSAGALVDALANVLGLPRPRGHAPEPTDGEDEPTRAYRLQSRGALPRIVHTSTGDREIVGLDPDAAASATSIAAASPRTPRRIAIVSGVAALVCVAGAGVALERARAQPPAVVVARLADVVRASPRPAADVSAPVGAPVEAPSAAATGASSATPLATKRGAARANRAAASSAPTAHPIDFDDPWPVRPIDKKAPF